MRNLNPDHFIRVAFALYLKKMKISKAKFTNIYYGLAAEIGYVDAHNREYGEYQIDSIYDNPGYVKEPKCSTIKSEGFCLGGCRKGCRGKRGVCQHGKCLRYKDV
jgi:DNA primase large subunit